MGKARKLLGLAALAGAIAWLAGKKKGAVTADGVWEDWTPEASHTNPEMAGYGSDADTPEPNESPDTPKPKTKASKPKAAAPDSKPDIETTGPEGQS